MAERAWRKALQGITDPARLTTEIYQAHVAGKPRLSGARAVLEQLGVPDAAQRTLHYAERKQRRLEELIRARAFTAFPDALRFVQAVEALRFRLAVASSSKNANEMMQLIRVDAGRTLLDVFAANVCGRDLCARANRTRRFSCLPQRIWAWRPPLCPRGGPRAGQGRAAKAGGMAAPGVARLGDEALLRAAGADLVVTSLDEVAMDPLAEGLLRAGPK